MKEKLIAAGIIIGALVLMFGLSWILTCGVVKLITLCFGWTFKWSIATGIWLVSILLTGIFKSNVTVDK